jgi:hypothetical protein
LEGAYLRYGYFQGTDLRNASLQGASIWEGKLIGKRPIFTFGPIGENQDMIFSFFTDKGIKIQVSTGHVFGSVKEFRESFSYSYSGNWVERDYEYAIISKITKLVESFSNKKRGKGNEKSPKESL